MTINGYTLGRYIGTGYLGSVYEMMKNENKFAVKKLYDPGEERLDLEKMTKCKSSNIVELHDFFRHDGRLYLVMDLERQTLRNALEFSKSGQVKIPVMKVFIGLADGLECLHKVDIIHGNLKPENVFLSELFEVKLGDFGLKALINTSDMNSTSIGEWSYFAPEIFKDEGICKKSDIWSLGVIAYEMIMKKLPFESSELIAEATSHSDLPFRPIPRESPYFCTLDLISRMLKNSTVERPTAAEIVKELDNMRLYPRFA